MQDAFLTNKLLQLQAYLYDTFGMKVDVYREEGKGVVAVIHGRPLVPQNVIYALSDFKFLYGIY